MANQNRFPSKLLIRFEVELPTERARFPTVDLRGIHEQKGNYEDLRHRSDEFLDACPAILQQALKDHGFVVQRITRRIKQEGQRTSIMVAVYMEVVVSQSHVQHDKVLDALFRRTYRRMVVLEADATQVKTLELREPDDLTQFTGVTMTEDGKITIARIRTPTRLAGGT